MLTRNSLKTFNQLVLQNAIVYRQRIPTTSTYRTFSSNYDYHSENKQKPKYFKHLLKLGAGSLLLALGFKLSFNQDSWKRKILFNFNLIPTVSAALPFFANDDDNEREDIKNNNASDKKVLRKQFNFIADVVEKVNDGVVYIEIKDNRRYDHTGKAIAVSNGSGCIISEDGLILTNAHVVTKRPRTSSVLVRLQDGREFIGNVEEIDALSDLALVRINCKNLPIMNLGNSNETRPGEFVVALGSPLSLSNTITFGVISSVGRGSKELGIQNNIDYIQTDAAITFGNSGGPLVNLDGEVIGINSMKVTSGISFAIPVDYAKEFLNKVKDKREKKEKLIPAYKQSSSKRRYLGITMLSLSPDILLELQNKQSAFNSPRVPNNVTHGVLVWRVVVGSPAYHAGLQPGDIVTHVNGKEITSSRNIYDTLDGQGDLNMVVQRGNQRYTVTVSPEE